MSTELLINVTPSETRVAMVESGTLQEVHIERESKRGIVGNIYKGRVSRVLPGMQAAFVDIGLEKAAFLHASDIVRTPNVWRRTRSSSSKFAIFLSWFAKGRIWWYRWSKIRWVPRALA